MPPAPRYAAPVTAQPVEDDVDADHEAILHADGSVTLSDQVLAEANLADGDKLVVEVVADGVLRLVRRRHPLLDLAGAFPGVSAATDLEGLRDEWER
jgi:hypothetical protein